MAARSVGAIAMGLAMILAARAAAAGEPGAGSAAPAEEPADDADEEEVVVAPRVTREATSVSISTDQGRKVAGTQGDALKVVQNLPGVARSSFGGGQIVVWGSA